MKENTEELVALYLVFDSFNLLLMNHVSITRLMDAIIQ